MGAILKTVGGYKDFWYIVNSANGADFAITNTETVT